MTATTMSEGAAAGQAIRVRRNFTKAEVRRDVEAGRVVAVKSLRGRSRLDRYGVAGFLLRREARMLARLKSLGIVPRIVRAEHDELAAEWVHGEPVRARGQRGITVREGDQVRSVVGRLHAAGYAHGDIGPRDVLVDGRRAMLIDLATCTGPGAPPLVGRLLMRMMRRYDRVRTRKIVRRAVRRRHRFELLRLAAERPGPDPLR